MEIIQSNIGFIVLSVCAFALAVLVVRDIIKAKLK